MNYTLEQSTNAYDFFKWKWEVSRALSAKGVFDSIEVPATSTSKASARKDAVAKTVIFEKLHDELSRNIENSKLSARQIFELITSLLKFGRRSSSQRFEWTAQPSMDRFHELPVPKGGWPNTPGQIWPQNCYRRNRKDSNDHAFTTHHLRQHSRLPRQERF